MSHPVSPRHRIELLYRPGRSLTPDALAALVDELRDVAADCFDELPDYQCLRGTREELADKVITLARAPTDASPASAPRSSSTSPAWARCFISGSPACAPTSAAAGSPTASPRR
ncbi:MAG: hypothetical protein IPK07_34755 [Deltaproteobacteria bacterium]|nr:hypothetical protein [Deltaproteobacteria bacterium]